MEFDVENPNIMGIVAAQNAKVFHTQCAIAREQSFWYTICKYRTKATGFLTGGKDFS
ncbi:hypothetical protein HMPREF0262_01118 [Clostridium sp. ATCC 29733]|nr:hypothetical protein HMPREF0262_01118 [Clostridium sp. ATCC 29733]